MNPEQCNRLIAESGLFKYPEIIPMGGKWRIHKPDSPYYQEYYEDFDPYHNPTHAHMALEKFCKDNRYKWSVGNCFENDDDFWCQILTHNYSCFMEGGTTPSAAISEAIASALEGKE